MNSRLPNQVVWGRGKGYFDKQGTIYSRSPQEGSIMEEFALFLGFVLAYLVKCRARSVRHNVLGYGVLLCGVVLGVGATALRNHCGCALQPGGIFCSS